MTEPTQSSSSPAPDPGGTSTPIVAPAAGSDPTPSSPAGNEPKAPTRPSWVPETYWADGKVKDAEFGAYLAEMSTRLAAEDVRRATLPKTADEYKLALPADFKPPQGVEFKLDEANPLFAQARAWALKHGLSQDVFSEGLGLVAGSQVSSEATIKAARDAEVAKLGPTGPARIDALSRFFNGYLGENEGKQVMARVFTASDVNVLEKLVGRIAGGAAFTATGREPPQDTRRWTPEQYSKATAAERLAYSRSFDQSKMPEWRDPRAA